MSPTLPPLGGFWPNAPRSGVVARAQVELVPTASPQSGDGDDLSHVVGLGAGYTVLARRAPWELWTVLVAAAPLIVQRQAYVRSELRRGAPSGEFGD